MLSLTSRVSADIVGRWSKYVYIETNLTEEILNIINEIEKLETDSDKESLYVDKEDKMQILQQNFEQLKTLLSDKNTIADFSFIFRRWLQKKYKYLFSESFDGEFAQDLRYENNIKWSENVNREIASRLADILKSNLINKELIFKFLNGSKVPTREQIFEIAITLKIPRKIVCSLLFSVDYDIINVRNMPEFVYYFCILVNSKKTKQFISYSEANKIISSVKEKVDKARKSSIMPTIGETSKLKNEIKSIAKNSKLSTRKKKKILKTFIVTAANEFRYFSVTNSYALHSLLVCLKKLDAFEKYNFILGEYSLYKSACTVSSHSTNVDFKLSDISSNTNPINIHKIDNLFSSEKLSNEIVATLSGCGPLKRNNVVILTYVLFVELLCVKIGNQRHLCGGDIIEDIANLLVECNKGEAAQSFDNYLIKEINKIINLLNETSYNLLSEALKCGFDIKILEAVNGVLSSLGFPNLYTPDILDRLIILSLKSGYPDIFIKLLVSEDISNLN